MKRSLTLITTLITFLLAIFIISQFTNAANTVGGNYKNVTVQTRVNITNSKPTITEVVIYQETNISQKNITLNGGSLRLVTCNTTVRDYNGYADITNVNATLYHTTSNSSASDNNNTHYTNTSCTLTSGNGYFGVYNCGFNVVYYALNGTWTCNATAIDTYNKTSSLTNTTIIYPLYALNVTDGIDYGNVAVEDYSQKVNANITNFGNMAINISVEGYGVTRGDGLAMNCSLSGNITVENQKFALSELTNYNVMTALSSSAQHIPGLTIPKQNDTELKINNTYWQLYIPPNPAGNCTGYVIFQAEAP